MHPSSVHLLRKFILGFYDAHCFPAAKVGTDQGSFQQFLENLRSSCPSCVDPDFSKHILDYTSDLDMSKVKQVRALLEDVLLHGCASSINVERQHVSTLKGNRHEMFAGRYPKVIQLDSYVTSARIEHKKVQAEAGLLQTCLHNSIYTCMDILTIKLKMIRQRRVNLFVSKRNSKQVYY